MNTNWVLQSPSESKQHEIDWSSELEGGGENEILNNSVWMISPQQNQFTCQSTGGIIDDGIIDTDGTKAIVVVSNLTLGKSYQILNTITTSKNRILSREITIRCDYR